MDGLAALAQQTLAQDPFSGAVLVFRTKRADRVKLLFWDGSGLVRVSKRLERGGFQWPPVMDGLMRLSPAQLAALIERSTGRGCTCRGYCDRERHISACCRDRARQMTHRRDRGITRLGDHDSMRLVNEPADPLRRCSTPVGRTAAAPNRS
jgi:hypothetical protein